VDENFGEEVWYADAEVVEGPRSGQRLELQMMREPDDGEEDLFNSGRLLFHAFGVSPERECKTAEVLLGRYGYLTAFTWITNEILNTGYIPSPPLERRSSLHRFLRILEEEQANALGDLSR